MSANWRTRCDWCGWPMVPHPEPGCWDGNCSMRPMKELTPAQAQVVELKQEIRKLERHQVNHSAPSDAERLLFRCLSFLDNDLRAETITPELSRERNALCERLRRWAADRPLRHAANHSSGEDCSCPDTGCHPREMAGKVCRRTARICHAIRKEP